MSSQRDWSSLGNTHLAPLLRVRELIRDRSILHAFIAQDLKLRYRGSMLGFMWALLNPLLLLTVLACVFTFPFSPDYPLHLFATLLPRMFFTVL